MMMRRVLGSMALAVTLACTALPAAEAAAPALKKLSLTSYTMTVGAPDAPATVCDYNEIHCGYLGVEATFAGLNRLPRPAGAYGPPEAGLYGAVEVTRVYGCQTDAGQRLHRYDTRVSETASLNTRRGSGLRFPRTGDTVTATTYAFLTDAQPGNCPAGTTPMIYKLVAKQVQLELDAYVPEIPDGRYRAPYRGQWLGAVPAPTVPAPTVTTSTVTTS
ncbi:MAG: hypothetical protein ABIR83_14220 [Nakamurella sp.]